MTSLFQMASGAKQEKTEPDVNDYSKHYENLLIGVTGDDRDRFFKGIEKIHENDQLPGALPSLDDIYQTGLQVEAETTGPSWEGVGDIGWEVFKHLPQAGAAAAISRIQGISGVNVINPDIFERYQNEVRKDGERLSQYAHKRYKDKTIPFVPFVKITDLAELEQSIGFSMVAGAEGLVVGAAVMAVTENPVLAYLAGMTETGASAYNMAGNAFMYEVLNYHNEEMNRLEGRNLLPEEQEILRDQAEYAAMQTGLWEAIPEAIGSGLGFGIINNMLKKAFGPGLAMRIATSLAGMYGEELVTETVTQMGQKSIAFEAAKEGLLPTEGREEIDFSNYGDWVKSLKEVAPAVFLLTTAMGGSTAVATKAYDSTIGNKRREAKMVDLVINATKTGQILSPVITDEVFDDFYMKSVDLAQKNPDNEELQASMKVIEQVATLRNNRTKPIEGSFEKFEENPFNEQNNDEIIDKTIQESKPEGVTEKGQAIIDQAFDEDMVKLQQLAEKVTSATLPLQYTPEELELVGNYPEQFEAKLKQAEAQLPKSEQASFDTAKTRNLNEKRKEKIEQEAREKAFDIELAINEGEMFDGVIEEVAIHPEVYNKISPFQKKEYDRLYAKLNKLNNEYKFLYRKGDALTKEGINRVNELEGDFTVEGLISKAQGKVGEYLKTLPKPPTASIKTQVKEIKEILQSEIEVHQRIYIDYIPGDWFLTGTPALNIKNEYYEGGLNPKFIKDEQEFERFKEFVIDDQKRLSAKRTAKLKSLLKELENKKNVTEKDIAKYKKELKESLKDSKRPDMRKLWAKYKGNLTDAQKSGFKTKRVGLKISADRTIKMISKDTI
ncbi:hypothetical protein H8E88_31930, partial [candidate division KSB1 bacterium]|nr:hypothetical protein [candidate division KSB1 bacterium]